MTAATLTIVRAELTAEVSRSLIHSLNEELSGAYSEPGATHFKLDPEEVAAGRGCFLIVYRAGIPVGCGALRLLDVQTAELKRMYVIPTARGTGLGKSLVAALETEARALGVRRLVLETGVRQAAALALYRATGFQPIPLYGEYCLSPETSVCLGKELLGHHQMSAVTGRCSAQPKNLLFQPGSRFKPIGRGDGLDGDGVDGVQPFAQ